MTARAPIGGAAAHGHRPRRHQDRGRGAGRGRAVLAEHRMPSPRHDYGATVRAIGAMVRALEAAVGGHGSVGIGIPGSVAPASGLVQNANSTWLNGKPLQRDLEAHLGRPVRLANDANCFALSEAVDGAGAGARGVFGVILGTGCGGGLVLDGAIIDGPRGIGGEWGHNPLPWASAEEHPGPTAGADAPAAWRPGSPGPASRPITRARRASGSRPRRSRARATAGDAGARATLDRHASRLARGLAHVINIFDPDVIVLGGGLSKLAHLYEVLPDLAAPHVFAEPAQVVVKPPAWGDAGGVRGAAWLWQ